MKIFITGATGFIGANLARRLIESDKEVHILTRPASKMWRLDDILDKIHCHNGDLINPAGLNKVIAKIKPDIVYHLAVYGAYSKQNEPEKIIKTNILGTFNLIKSCRINKVKIIVNTGSSSEYGFKKNPMKETDFLEPNSYYAVSKAAQTMLCNYSSRLYNFPIITLRIFNIYGPWEEPGRLMPTLIVSCLENKDLNLVDPKVARDFVYIDDLLDVYLKVAKHPELGGEIINVGSGRQSTIKDVVKIIMARIKTTSRANWGSMPKRIWDSNNWQADIGKIKKMLNWSPKYTLESGLKKSIAWFKNNKQFYL